jgi:beta-glucosidase
MNGRPVIVCMALTNPSVVAEFEPQINGLVVSFGVQDQALMDILSGKTEPSGLLPLQMPADMETVETQKEDVPLDMRPYRDSEGHLYDFAYGLNWKGLINDARTIMYKK